MTPTNRNQFSLDQEEDHGAIDREHHYLNQQEANELLLTGKSSHHSLPFGPFQSSEQSVCERYTGEEHPHGSVMPSKKLLMRKMMSSDPITIIQATHDHQQLVQDSNTNSSSCIIRVCSDCSTMKTPLWRSGPRGPKSLCNACGIRQRKARRAMAAASVTGGSTIGDTPSKVQKEKRSDGDCVVPFKKRWKFAT